MAFRFRRRVRVLPGVWLNVSRRGVSTSIGGRGAHVTLSDQGTRTTVGLPGTGLSWTELKKPDASAPRPAPIAGGSPWPAVLAILALIVIMAAMAFVPR